MRGTWAKRGGSHPSARATAIWRGGVARWSSPRGPPHPAVVHCRREVVRGSPVGPEDDEVVEVAPEELDVSLHKVEDLDPVWRHHEPDGRRRPRPAPVRGLLGREGPAAAVVPRRETTRQELPPLSLKSLGSAEAGIGLALIEAPVHGGAVGGKPLGLPVRPRFPLRVGPLVPAETGPPQSVEGGRPGP